MDLAAGVSLMNFLKSHQDRRLPECECRYIFSQIVKGINYCHFKSICHRDIKMENIIIEEGNKVKIIDFGFSVVSRNDKLLNLFCGTPSYLPPEIVLKKDYVGI